MRRLLVLAALLVALPAGTVTIDWVPVGDPGNAPDTATNCLLDAPDCGSVPSVYMTGFWDVEQLFALGARLGTPDPHEKRELRRLLLLLNERDAQRLFALLRQPERMNHAAFLDLIGHEKLAARWTRWSRHQGVDKALWAELAAAPGVPVSLRRIARAHLYPPRRVVAEARFEEAGKTRVLSREELYDLVWSEPLLTLAKRCGLSDNGLRKRCKAMNVPTPPRGYWQQPQQRRRKMRPSLPPLG